MVPPKQSAYLQGAGSGEIPSYIFPDPPRDPTTNDFQHSLLSRWINTLTGGIWYLESFTIVNSVSQANWRAVAPIVVKTVPPSSADSSYPVGQTWVDTLAQDYWALVNVTGGVAVWNSLSPLTSSHPITPYVVGLTGNSGYSTIQSAITAANTAGGGVVYIQQGSYTEDLTLFSGVDLYATPAVSQNQGASVSITGTHIPPDTGHVGFNSICFISTTDVFSSAATGTTHLVLTNCESAVQNGYLMNLVNWTGIIEIFDFNPSTAGAPFPVNDGGINNTGGATVVVFDAGLGIGTNPLIMSGVSFFGAVNVGCPVNLVTGSTLTSHISSYVGTVNLLNNSTLDSDHDIFTGGVNAAILMSSSGSSAISHAVISSSNVPSIDGSGAGTLTLGAISFTFDATLSATLTLGTTANFLPGTATPYGVLCGGTTDPGAMQSVAAIGVLGQVLTSNGAAALPTFQTPPVGLPVDFSAFLGTTDASATGNGITYIFGTSNALTIIFDTGGDFSTSGVFTAPSTAKYRFSFSLVVESITSIMTLCEVRLVTTARTYYSNLINIASVRDSNNQYSVSGTFLADMSSTDICTLEVEINGGAGDTAGIIGDATQIRSSFAGEIIL